jgi:sialidase-1
MQHLRAFLLLLLFYPAVPALADQPLKHVDVYVSGKDGYAAYRIPAIETAANGDILAFAEARKNNLHDPGEKGQEIDLVLKRSTDGGATWSAMKIIEHSGELWSSANPCTVVDRTNGRVWVFYLRCKPGRGTAEARPGTDDVLNLARWSDDHGATWSEPIDQTSVARDMADGRWRLSVPGPGGAIQDRKGRLIVPMWRFAPWDAFVLMSEDHGRTWQRGACVPGLKGGDEDQVVELADGRILFDIRQRAPLDGRQRRRRAHVVRAPARPDRDPGVLCHRALHAQVGRRRPRPRPLDRPPGPRAQQAGGPRQLR